MKDYLRYSVVRLSLLLTIVFMAGCDNNNDYGELPTRVQLPIDTPTSLVEIPSSATSPPASATPTLVPEATTSDTPPTVTVEATTVSANPTPVLLVEVITDYSALTIGQSIMLYDELALVVGEEGDEPTALMVDEAGNELEIILIPGIAETLLGRPIDIAGIVVSPEESVSGRLAVRPNAVDTLLIDSPNNQSTPASDFDPARPPTALPATLDVLLAPIPGAERPLTVGIAPGLSPLQTYDELMALIGGDVQHLFWISLRGSLEIGYQVEFWDEETATITVFRIDIDGNIYMSSRISLPSANYYHINRADIYADIVELVDGDPRVSTSEGSLTYVLEAPGESTTVWTVLRDDTVVAVYDAITPPE